MAGSTHESKMDHLLSVRSNHLTSYENRYGEGITPGDNQLIAAEHSFLKRHTERAKDSINRKLLLAQYIDPRSNGVGSYGGHIARHFEAPGPLNNAFIPNIGKGFSADVRYGILRRNMKFQEQHSVHNPTWDQSFIASNSLALHPVYHFPSKNAELPLFESEMDKYRLRPRTANAKSNASVAGSSHANGLPDSAGLINKDWKLESKAGKQSYILTLHDDIVKKDLAKSKKAETKQRAKSADIIQAARDKLSSNPPRTITKNDNFDDNMTAVTTFTGANSNFNEADVISELNASDMSDEARAADVHELNQLEAIVKKGATEASSALVTSSVPPAPAIHSSPPPPTARQAQKQTTARTSSTDSTSAPMLMQTPEKAADAYAANKQTPTDQQFAYIESTFIGMEDQLKQLSLHIEMHDIHELLIAATTPPFVCLPLAGYVTCLCGSTVTFRSVIELLTHKPSNMLGFIHEVGYFTAISGTIINVS
jgi:hypothetical protein